MIAFGVALVIEVVFFVVINLVGSLLLSEQVVVVHGEMVHILLMLLLVLLDLVSYFLAINFNSVISTVATVLIFVVYTFCSLCNLGAIPSRCS